MHKLPLSRQLTYAAGQLGWSILINIVGLQLVYFYRPPDTAKLPELITQASFLLVLNAVTLLAASGRLFDAVTDPLIAGLSDRARFRRGRRIPFLAVGALPAAVFLVLMFLPPLQRVSGWNIVWAGFFQFLFYLALTVYVTPYFALLSELGHSAEERLNLSTWISITYALGIVLAGASPLLADALGGAFGIDNDLRSLQLAIGVLALLAVVLMYVPVLTIDERRYSNRTPSSVPLGASLRATFRNPHFRCYVAADFAYFTGITIILTGLLYYVTVLLAEEEELVTTLLTVAVFASFLIYPAVNLAAKKVGKKVLIVASFLAMSLVFLSIPFLGDWPISPLASAYLLILVYAVPLAFLGVLPNAVLADIANHDALRSGEPREGMFFAARTLLQKFGQTFGVLLFAALTTFGKDPGNDLGIRLSGTVGFALCLGAAVVFTRYQEQSVLGETEALEAAAST